MPMRWSDERYVRLYTRDTLTWLGWSLEAQGLFALLLRKVDRAGLLHLGRHGLRGVAAAVGHGSRWATIEPALAELVHPETGAFVLVGSGDTLALLLPKFIEAQEARASDAQRQREKRERDRALALALSLGVVPPPEAFNAGDVTKRDGQSQNVTDCHAGDVTPSRHAGDVTPSCAEPAVPSQPEEACGALSPADGQAGLEPAAPQDGTPPPAGEPVALTLGDLGRAAEDAHLEALADAWNANTSEPLPRWVRTGKARRRLALAALKRRPLAEWVEVFRRIGASDFCRGGGGQWRADPDWALRPEGAKPEPASRVMEGAFDNRTRKPSGPPRAQDVDWKQGGAGDAPF